MLKGGQKFLWGDFTGQKFKFISKKAILQVFLDKINWFYSPQALNYNLNTPFSPSPQPPTDN